MALLVVELDGASRAAVLDRARLPVLRGDHVTLAFGVDPAALDPAWIPGGATVGQTVEVRAVAELADARVQVLQVEVAGSSLRPHDVGILHVTVSRAEDARSRDANALLAEGHGEACALALREVVGWRE